MSGPGGKHRGPRRNLGGWSPADLALTDRAAEAAGESWAEWARARLLEAAQEELGQEMSDQETK